MNEERSTEREVRTCASCGRAIVRIDSPIVEWVHEADCFAYCTFPPEREMFATPEEVSQDA